MLWLIAVAGLVFMVMGGPAAAGEDERFFPPGVWGKPLPGSNETAAERDRLYERWFGGMLRADGESPLWVHEAAANASLSIRMSDFGLWELPQPQIVRIAAT